MKKADEDSNAGSSSSASAAQKKIFGDTNARCVVKNQQKSILLIQYHFLSIVDYAMDFNTNKKLEYNGTVVSSILNTMKKDSLEYLKKPENEKVVAADLDRLL